MDGYYNVWQHIAQTQQNPFNTIGSVFPPPYMQMPQFPPGFQNQVYGGLPPHEMMNQVIMNQNLMNAGCDIIDTTMRVIEEDKSK